MALPHSFYAPYRQPLDADEQQRLRAAEVEQRAFEAAHEGLAADHVEIAMGDGGLHGAASPLATAHIFIANIRATEQQAAMGCTVPDDPTVCDRYPGVDPLGKYCEVDMAFAQREQAVRAALLTRPAPVRQFVTEMLDRAGRTRALLDANGNRIPDPVRLMRQNMSGDCMNIWMNERAAKLCFDETASDLLLEEAASQARGSASIRRYEGFMTTMEQLAGLKGGPISQDFRNTFRDNMQVEIPPAVEALRNAPDVVPGAIDINFPDFDGQLAQRFFSNPRNWGKTYRDLPQDVVNIDKAIDGIDRYATATVDNTVAAVFRGTEKNFGGTGPDDLNRANLLTVDGKLVGDLLRERHAEAFNSGKTSQPYADWFKENARRETARIVGAGLMAGKRVEAFVPDAHGKLPPEPVQVTKSGYEPKAMQPVTLNAWERFASKLGFYKEKVAAKEEYERVMAGRERAAKVYERGLANHDLRVAQRSHRELAAIDNDRLHELFFAGKEEELRAADNDTFRVSRTIPTSTCIGMLAARGHSFQDIIDPTKLKAERAAVAAEYIDHARVEDGAWLGRQYRDGYRAMTNFLDTFDSQHDLTDMRVVNGNIALLETVAHSAFDIFQEKDIGKAVFGTIAAYEQDHPGRGLAAMNAETDRCNTYSTYITLATRAARTRNDLITGERRPVAADMRSQLVAVLEADLANRLLAEARAREPDKRLGDLLPFSAILNTGAMATASPELQALAEQVDDPTTNPTLCQIIGRQMATGKFQAGAKITVTSTVNTPTYFVPKEVRNEQGVLTGLTKERITTSEPMNFFTLDSLTLDMGKGVVVTRNDPAKQGPTKNTGGRTR